jgi:hypothetical protein
MKTLYLLAIGFLLLLVLTISAGSASVSDVDKHFEDVRGALLGFYNSEIVTHAAIAFGLFVAFPTLLSESLKMGSFRKRFLLFLLLGLTASMIFYSIGRLFYWSSMGAYVMEVTSTSLGGNITETNVTSFMSLLNEHCMSAFWNDGSITCFFAKAFYPNWLPGGVTFIILILVGVFTSWKLSRKVSDASPASPPA